MAEAALLLVVLFVGLGGTVVLYLLVERETDRSREMDRSDAESYARRRSRERYDDAHDDPDHQ